MLSQLLLFCLLLQFKLKQTWSLRSPVLMAILCQKVASYSQVLDVVHVGLNLSNETINLLLRSKEQYMLTYRHVDVTGSELMKKRYYLSLSVEKWQREESDDTWRGQERNI